MFNGLKPKVYLMLLGSHETEFGGLGFLGFQAALSFVVFEEAEGSLIKQKLRRCRKGFG